jgi:penicillin amidase
MPGAPGFLVGRSSSLAWGATYAFIDSIDSWVEECRGGKYLRDGKWKDFTIRKETILRKKKKPVECIFYENEHGVLSGDASRDGFYLATKWTGAESGILTIKSFIELWNAVTVREGMELLGRVESYWNWVLADKEGNIGFQMSGLTPKRRSGISGFIPLSGSSSKNDWLGIEDYRKLPSVYNPKKGFFATANQDLNEYGKIGPSNMPMGPYRAERINQLCSGKNNFTMDDVEKMHFDFYSIQAERFMQIIRPLLPDTEQGRILKEWDLCYDCDSKGAFLFEELYKGLYREVFGKNCMGEGVVDFFDRESGVFIDFYMNFDRILLSKKSLWFNGRTREEVYRNAIENYLKVKPASWGSKQKVLFKNIVFDGKLPAFLGFDRGPFSLPGGRATIHQGQIYRSAGRVTTFYPSYRFITDFSKDEIRTNIAGGPSDRRFSKWYVSDLENWMKKKYKTIKPVSDKKEKI